MNTDPKQPPKDLSPGLRRSLQAEEEQLNERAQILDSAQHGQEVSGSDRSLPANRRHEYGGDDASKNKEFSQKIYLLPDSFNALRSELDNYWPTLFNSVDPTTGVSLAWCMAFKAEDFIAIMNSTFNTLVQYDTENVDGICKEFLNVLREKRGVSKLN